MTSEQETAMYDQPEPRDEQEELIEKAAKAMYEAPDPDQTESSTPWPPFHPEDLAWWLSRADAALTVFEEHSKLLSNLESTEAHTPANVSEPGKTDIPSAQMSTSGQIPTDDERAFAWTEYRKDYEPNPAHFGREHVAFFSGWDARGSFHRTVQGKPSDAMVEAGAREAFFTDDAGGHIRGGYTWDTIPEVGRDNYRTMVRGVLHAALRAAAAVQGGETR